MKGSPTLLAVLGPPPVSGAGGSGNGTSQHTKVGSLLGARAVTTINVDTKLVYLLPEVVEYLVRKGCALNGNVRSLISPHHSY